MAEYTMIILFALLLCGSIPASASYNESELFAGSESESVVTEGRRGDFDWDLENLVDMNLENIGFAANETSADVVESNLRSETMSFINEEVAVEKEKEEGGRRRSNVNWVLVGMGLSVGVVSVGIIAGIIVLTVKCVGRNKKSVRMEERV